MDGSATMMSTADASPEDGGPVAIPDGGTPPELPLCQGGFGDGDTLRDVAYAGVDERHRLDLYLTDAPGPNPLLIWVHGGGWRAGSKDRVNPLFLAFRERGYSIASIEYRLSSAAWPATVSDVKAAVRFLRAQSTRYNLDSNRFVAMGSSAGGHLVAMLATSANDPLFMDTRLGNSTVSDEVQAVVNFYGPSDLDQMDPDAAMAGCPAGGLCHDCEDSPETMLLDCRPSECTEVADQASPVNHVSGDEPPVLSYHGDDDCTVPPLQSRRLHEALTAADSESILVEVPGAGHNVNQCLTEENLATMQAFVERAIRGCRDAEAMEPPEDSELGACLWEHCPTQAAACDENAACVALEVCFQDCFSRELGMCIRRCTGSVPDAAEGRVQHEPLFECGRANGCYR